jgi:hypothetical protein
VDLLVVVVDTWHPGVEVVVGTVVVEEVAGTVGESHAFPSASDP